MKKILLSILIFIPYFIFSQNYNLSGEFKNGNNYIKIFPDSTLEFLTSNNNCLSVLVKGYGKYSLKDSIINIYTRDTVLSGNSKYSIIGNCDSLNKIEFEVHDDKMNVIPYVSIVANNGKKIKGGNADKGGKYKITLNSNYEFVAISYIGYDYGYKIPVKNILGKKIDITLMPYQIIRMKHIEFHIRRTADETLIVGPYFFKEKSKKRNCSSLTIFKQENKKS